MNITETKLLTFSATTKKTLWWEWFFILIEFKINLYLIQCDNN